MSDLPKGLQNAINASRRELAPKDADRDRVWQGVQAALPGTGEPVELAARVRSLDEQRERRPMPNRGRVYAAATVFALAAGVLGYLTSQSLNTGGSARINAAPPPAVSALPDAGADGARVP